MFIAVVFVDFYFIDDNIRPRWGRDSKLIYFL